MTVAEPHSQYVKPGHPPSRPRTPATVFVPGGKFPQRSGRHHREEVRLLVGMPRNPTELADSASVIGAADVDPGLDQSYSAYP